MDSLELWNNDAEDIVNAIMDRYRDVEGSAWKEQHATDQRTYTNGWKSTVAYLPSVTDGDIWKVAVTVVFRLHYVSKVQLIKLSLAWQGGYGCRDHI